MIDLAAWLVRLVLTLALCALFGLVMGAGAWVGWHLMGEWEEE